MKSQGDLIVGEQAKDYDILSPKSLIYKKILKYISLKRGEKLLDVGCGTGTILKKLADKYKKTVDLVGIDPAEDMYFSIFL